MRQEWKGFLGSFRHAFRGVASALKTQRNLRIDFCVGVAVLVLAWILPLSTFELLWVVFSVFLVIIFEMLNSLIEELLDLFYPYFHEKVKRAKDIAAGMVLVAAFFAFSVGIIIFGKRLFHFADAVGVFAFLLFLSGFLTFLLRVLHRKESNGKEDTEGKTANNGEGEWREP
ncbi:MAG TPA: diacylglycerol kinase family protein [Thermotogota bacterium]|nr:diacylglycerol kinase family protein [Thermotogota bacterium]